MVEVVTLPGMLGDRKAADWRWVAGWVGGVQRTQYTTITTTTTTTPVTPGVSVLG